MNFTMPPTQGVKVATATKKKPEAAKRPRKRAQAKPAAQKAANDKAAANGKATIDRNGDDPNQTYLPGTEPPKVPAIETIIKKYRAADSVATTKREECKSLLPEFAKHFKKHELTQYKSQGVTVSIRPGADVVKISKASTK